MPLPENAPLGRLPFEPPENSSTDLDEFWELWRVERFWACHESLEEVWKSEKDGARKLFLRGLIHGAVAVFQFRRGNFVGAARQFTRAKIRLENALPARENVDLEEFLGGIETEIAPSFAFITEKQREDLEKLENFLRGQK